MTENMSEWHSGHRKSEKSGHRLAAEKTLFPRRWYGGMISAILEDIWEMSVNCGKFEHMSAFFSIKFIEFRFEVMIELARSPAGRR